MCRKDGMTLEEMYIAVFALLLIGAVLGGGAKGA